MAQEVEQFKCDSGGLIPSHTPYAEATEPSAVLAILSFNYHNHSLKHYYYNNSFTFMLRNFHSYYGKSKRFFF